MAKSVTISGCSIQECSIYMDKEETSLKNITLNWTAAASCFQGRSDSFTAIKQAFTTNRIIVLHGMPGIGKTETTRNFANRNSEYYKNNLIWIFADTPENIQQCFDTLAKTLNLEITDVSQIYFKFKTSRALFIFDNTENMSSIKNFLPPSQVRGSIDVLITSRLSTWDSAISTIHLDSLKIEDALEIFKTKLGDKFKEHSIEIWTKLVEQLDGIPLCLQIVSSLIYQQLRRIRLTKFNLGEFFEELKETFIHLTIPETEQNYYNKTVLSAIYSALSQLKKEKAEVSIDLLCYIAYLNADRIYDDELIKFPLIKMSIKLLEEALNKLSDYTLIHVSNSTPRIRVKVHRTVQQVLREYDLSRKNGQIIKSIWRFLLPVNSDFNPNSHPVANHLRSILICVKKKEYQPIALDVCNDDDFPLYEFVLGLAHYHCDEILDKLYRLIKTKFKKTKKYVSVVNKMFYWAISRTHTDLNTIHLLINHGATITGTERFISGATEWLSTDLLDIVLQLNSRDNIWPKDHLKILLLRYTIRHSSANVKKAINCVNHLIELKKANIFYKDKQSNNILHFASENFYLLEFEMIKYLIEKFNLKSLINSQNKVQETPLHALSEGTKFYFDSKKSIQIYSYLIHECKADITIQDANGWNILFRICCNGNFDLILWFLKNTDCSKIINVRDYKGNVAFIFLILSQKLEEYRKIELVAHFAHNEMNFNVLNKNHEYLYEIALRAGLKELSQVLKKRCKALNACFLTK